MQTEYHINRGTLSSVGAQLVQDDSPCTCIFEVFHCWFFGTDKDSHYTTLLVLANLVVQYELVLELEVWIHHAYY